MLFSSQQRLSIPSMQNLNFHKFYFSSNIAGNIEEKKINTYIFTHLYSFVEGSEALEWSIHSFNIICNHHENFFFALQHARSYGSVRGILLWTYRVERMRMNVTILRKKKREARRRSKKFMYLGKSWVQKNVIYFFCRGRLIAHTNAKSYEKPDNNFTILSCSIYQEWIYVWMVCVEIYIFWSFC